MFGSSPLVETQAGKKGGTSSLSPIMATLEALEREETELYSKMTLEIQFFGEKMKIVRVDSCNESFSKLT